MFGYQRLPQNWAWVKFDKIYHWDGIRGIDIEDYLILLFLHERWRYPTYRCMIGGIWTERERLDNFQNSDSAYLVCNIITINHPIVIRVPHMLHVYVDEYGRCFT